MNIRQKIWIDNVYIILITANAIRVKSDANRYVKRLIIKIKLRKKP